MPRDSWCWCLGGSRPPEITYGVEVGVPIKSMPPDLPMPTDEEELMAKFEELVAELGLDKPHRDALFNLPSEKKWQIYCSKKKEEEDPTKASWPDYYIESINTMSSVYFGFNEDEGTLRTKLVDDLKTALRTQPMSFVLRFIELSGLQCLLDFLTRMDYEMAQSLIHTSVIGCIKALMNNPQGRAHVLGHPNGVNIIAQSLATDNVKTEIAVLEILGAMCLVPGGHRKVLQAMVHYQNFAAERTRFQRLVNDLDCSTGAYREEVSLKTAIMSFINAALKYGPGQHHLEFRIHLRYELLMLGIQPVIDKLRSHENATLDRHLDFFEMVRMEDEKELAKRFNCTHIDSKSASAMFDLLKKKLAFSVSYSHLLSMLQHFTLIPFGNQNQTTMIWMLLDRIVQQVVIQQKNGENPDIAPLDINVKQLVRQLSQETEIKSVYQKMREVEKLNDDLQSKLKKKDRECEIKTEEKEELMSTVSKMKLKVDKESSSHYETKGQLTEVMAKLDELHAQLDAERAERGKLQHLIKTGSLPDDAKMDFSHVSPFNGTASASFLLSHGTPPITPPIAPPPPPPPPIGGPPAPPPPPPFSSGIPGPPPPPGFGPAIPMPKKKNIPTPSHPLKSFNWAKLPENKVAGTIWNDLDDVKMYKSLDLDEFEKTFSAYQRKQSLHEDDDSLSMQPKSFTKSFKNKELSVIDGRRAQNCTILLSKLKLTSDEMRIAVLNMDQQEDLPKDMLEQLLKYVPSTEEAQLLSEHSAEIDQMARADRFLYEMTRITHYEQRLKALYFKKKFSERISDIKPKIEDVIDASKEVIRSKKLRKLLEVVLALGNFMNRGQRGNASGFKLLSLNKIIDTKSSLNKNFTLLNYLLQILESKFPDVTKLDEDLKHVHNACKASFVELDKDLAALRQGLKEIHLELTFFRSQPYMSDDKFVSVMTDFTTVASCNFSDVEDAYLEMKQKYDLAVRLFGEDSQKIQPDDFFQIFNVFLSSFTDAKAENEKLRKQKEDEAKRVKVEEQLRKEKEKQRASRHKQFEKSTGIDNSSNGGNEEKSAGEFDDLISALRTGDVFGDDMAKMKRVRRKGANAANFGRERIGGSNA